MSPVVGDRGVYAARTACAGVQALVLVCVCLLAQTADAGAVGSGRVTIAQNDVQGREVGRTGSLPTRPGTGVEAGQVWETGDESSLQVLFPGQALLSAGEATVFIVGAQRGEIPAAESPPAIEFTAGVMRVLGIGAGADGHEFFVVSGSLAVGLRDSEAVIERTDKGTILVTILAAGGDVRWRLGEAEWNDLGLGDQLVLATMSVGEPIEVREVSQEARVALYLRTLPVPDVRRSRPRMRDIEDYGPAGSGR